jgi:hypothetical protein
MFTGCGSRKTALERTTEVATSNVAASADTFRYELVRVTSETVSEARATVSATVNDIKSLPEVAVITARNDRASVTIRYLRDTVTVTAICDSLQRQVVNYELREKSYINTISEQKKQIKIFEKKQQKNSIFTTLKYLFIGILTGVIAMLLFTKKTLINSIIEFIKKIFKK